MKHIQTHRNSEWNPSSRKNWTGSSVWVTLCDYWVFGGTLGNFCFVHCLGMFGFGRANRSCHTLRIHVSYICLRRNVIPIWLRSPCHQIMTTEGVVFSKSHEMSRKLTESHEKSRNLLKTHGIFQHPPKSMEFHGNLLIFFKSTTKFSGHDANPVECTICCCQPRWLFILKLACEALPTRCWLVERRVKHLCYLGIFGVPV